MDKNKRSVLILNLIGEISPALLSYFQKKEITLINESDWNEEIEVTHIIIQQDQLIDVILDKFRVKEKNIKLISITPLDNYEKFITWNGRLAFNTIWLETKLGEFILDKFVEEYSGVEVSDSYPHFEEKGSFNITNPYNTGEYTDRLTYDAHESGYMALSIKTYFDHLIMYLNILKTENKAGFPFEVSYGEFENVFGLQIHFFSKDVKVEDLINSLSLKITKGSNKYLLNIATQSADFFDFTYLEQVNKIVITALWSKISKLQQDAGGILIGELTSASELSTFPSTGEEESFLVKGESTSIPDSVQVIKGSEEEADDSVQVIKATEEEIEDVVQVIKGTMEEAKEVVQRIPGEKFDVDNFTYKIAAGVQDKSKEGNFKVKRLGDNLQDKLKEGLFDFSQKIGKQIDDLDSNDMVKFKDSVVPQVVSEAIKVSSNNTINKKDKKKDNANDEVSPREKLMEQRLSQVVMDNENLKSKLGSLMAELRAQKQTQAQLNEARNKAQEAAEEELSKIVQVDTNDDDKKQLLDKLTSSDAPSPEDFKRLKELLERDKQSLETAKQDAMKAKKIQIEASQKETMYMKELEKSQREIKAKELIITKTKEMVTQSLEKKEAELSDLKLKLDMANKALQSSSSDGSAQQLRELERQNANQTKMIDMYKEKIATLSSAVESNKSEDGSAREEARKAILLNNQLKNQLDIAKRDFLKLQEKSNADAAMLLSLKAEKSKLEQDLKKSASAIPKEAAATKQLEADLKKAQGHTQLLEAQLKESTIKVKDLEQKLAEATKIQQTKAASDDGSKVKVTQLENSLKKITQDLVTSQNQMAEMKKEVNKSRQEKVALQNQIDKLKKDVEKSAKKNTPPGGAAGGKAA